MLRCILGAGKKRIEPERSENEDTDNEVEPKPADESEDSELDLETWAQWILRTSGIVEGQLRKTGLDDWCTAIRRKKWRWAGYLARREDGSWSTKLLDRQPTAGRRIIGRPCKRWVNELDGFFMARGSARGSCSAIAQNRGAWCDLEVEFVKQ